MTFNWIQIIGIFTLIQLVFLSVVTWHYRKGKRISNRLLSGFLISNALLIASFLLWQFKWFVPGQWTFITGFAGSLYLLLTPFLYLYLCSLCYNDFRLKPVHLLHVLPFVVTGLFRWYVSGVASSAPELMRVEQWSYTIIMHLQILSYLIASVALLVAYRKRLKEFYSSIEKIDLAWCNLLIGAFTAMWLTDLLHWILGSSRLITWQALGVVTMLSLLINLLFTLAMTYKGLVQSESFSGILGIAKYATSRLTPAEIDAIVGKLRVLMEREKPFMTASLTIEDLAGRLDIPVRQLSQAIHSGLNQNFYDFVNSYRIEESKKCICDQSYSNQTLLAVAYDVGFNSKSVFNASFKKHTGMTPKEFKRLKPAPSTPPGNN